MEYVVYHASHDIGGVPVIDLGSGISHEDIMLCRNDIPGALPWLRRDGRKVSCAIRSYLSTAAKHGLIFFGALVKLAEARPWMARHNVIMAERILGT
jgi:hypothetical protein